MRRFATAAAAGLVTSLLLGAAAAAQPDEEAARKAAQEIAAAQDRANEAAAKWSQAESDLGRLEDEAAQLTKERDDLQATVDTLQAMVSQAAAERFMSSGSAGIPILTGAQQPVDQMVANELSRVVAGGADDAFDQYAVNQRDLDRKRSDLADKQAEVQDQRENYEESSKQAAAEVEHLNEVEQKRLADERVRLALEAQRRKEQRREAQRQAAEAAQHAAEEAQRAAEQQRAAALQASAAASAAAAARPAAARPAAARPAASDTAAASAAAAPAPAASPAAARPAASDTAGPPVAAARPAASETAGPPVAAPAPAPDEAAPRAEAPTSSGMVCPVQGASAYSDTWGAPRPGGRRHQGVDLIASHGTPLVAVVDGTLSRRRQSSNGALTVSLDADDGNRYFYGHLSSYEGSEGRVSKGEVIGYVGNTGTTVNHLHFEVHPGGGGPVNPTGYVRNAGC